MPVIAADAHADLVESLDQRVRAAVRREGVDPQRDAIVVRRLAEAVVRAHDERSLTGVVAPVSDVDSMVGELVARVSGFGPLQPFLDDPSVEEVWINDPSRVFVARRGRHELTNLMLTSAQVQELVERMLKSSGLDFLRQQRLNAKADSAQWPLKPSPVVRQPAVRGRRGRWRSCRRGRGSSGSASRRRGSPGPARWMPW